MMRALTAAVATIVGAIVGTGGAVSTGRVGAPAPPPAAAQASSAAIVSSNRLLGQRIMVGVTGTYPSGALLRAVRAGAVGSVILFRQNITSRRQLQTLTGALQAAARAGGNPPLLISTDQEGGQVKRLPAGPPTLSPPQMRSSSTAYSQGLATGRYLRSLGINWDLAPVLDVPTFGGAFIWRQGRAFSLRSGTVARLGTQFALGLQRGGVAATGKHFPGVGTARVDTDNQLDELHPSASQLQGALLPYRTAIPRGLDSVMLSTAGFPSLDRSGAPAALSRPIATGLLRGQLRFGGVTITDALGTPTGHDEVTAGALAAAAGADVLLYTDSAPGVLRALERALRDGRLSQAEAVASYQRIVALKRRVGHR